MLPYLHNSPQSCWASWMFQLQIPCPPSPYWTNFPPILFLEKNHLALLLFLHQSCPNLFLQPPSQISLHIRVSLKTQNVSQRAPPGIYAVSICGGPPTKNSEFYLKFWPLAPHICFWVHHNGKRAPDGAKICNFQKLAWYSPKNGNTWTKCLPRHFLPKMPILKCQKWHFDRFHFWASIKPIFENYKH